jgi:colicin import membrane protein
VTPTKPSGPAPRGLAAAFSVSAFANAAVTASKKLQTQQESVAQQHAATMRRAQLVAFADMLKKREAAVKAAADRAAKIRAASQKVVPVALVAKPAEVQAIAASAQAAAAKIAGAAQKPQIRALTAPPRRTPGQPAARGLPARPQAARGPARVVIPAAALNPRARQAFAAAFRQDAQQMTQAGIAAARQRAQQRAQLRAAAIAKRQAEMARRLAAIPGVSDQQKQAFAAAYAQARPADRAQMIKQLPVSRLSSIPGTPFATKQANAQKVTPAKGIDTVEVNANILQAMRRLTH